MTAGMSWMMRALVAIVSDHIAALAQELFHCGRDVFRTRVAQEARHRHLIDRQRFGFLLSAA